MSSIIKVNTVQDQDGNNIINENANTITIGKSGDTVQVASGATLTGAGIEWQSSIVTAATHTASANQGLWLDTSSNAITLTLPGSPSVGDQLIITDYARNWETNAVTLSLNGSKFQGGTTLPIYNTNGQSVDIVYSGTTKGWIPNSDDDVTDESLVNYSATYLVVAGGASGGTGAGAGAGAGGLLTGTTTLFQGTTYTVTVGGGGAGVPGAPKTQGNDGVASSLTGADITNVTTVGGGGGGGQPTNSGRPGGSGGGEFSGNGVGSGTAGQGNDGGSASPGSGGGGGAGAVGGGGPNGAGGNGLANTITGSSVFYAGGGGAYGGGAAGNGGGSAGVPNPQSSSNATANTGGGSGAADDQPSGNGGSGVVILSVPDANYSGTTTGSPTVATGVSGKTVITFTGSGSYTG